MLATLELILFNPGHIQQARNSLRILSGEARHQRADRIPQSIALSLSALQDVWSVPLQYVCILFRCLAAPTQPGTERTPVDTGLPFGRQPLDHLIKR